MIINVNQVRQVLTEINRCCDKKAVVLYDEEGVAKSMEVECNCQVLCDECMEKMYDLLDWADGMESPNDQDAQQPVTQA